MSNAYSTEYAGGNMGVEARAAFIMRTYMHLFGAICAFIALEVAIFKSGLDEQITAAFMSLPWLVPLGAFMVISWVASRTAHAAKSQVAQYGALGIFIIAEALIFVPLLWMAQNFAKGGVIESAAVTTLAGFAALTAIAFVTRKDFSFLKGFLFWGIASALLLMVLGMVFGFELGLFFSMAMVVIAGAAILYDTSNIIHHYPEDRHVAASLELFASVALMFWYVLQLFMSRD